MVSNYPNSQPFDYRQMYDFSYLNPKKAPVYPRDSLMGVIDANKDLSIFSQLIKKANYENKLSSSQADFTVFVPSDASLIKKYSKKYLDELDRGTATQIINHSIMNRKLDQKLLQSSPVGKYPTISRSNSLEISTLCNETMIDGCIKVLHFNQPASNGIIHVVSDFVIKPFV
jgi:uncharacterized surface protein with fasciclin (FAS1) repeats